MDSIDFTSALYLGLQHPSRLLQPWQQLSLGVPAALAEPPGASRVARLLAKLQGCEQAILMPSTLHLFWDLFVILGKQPMNFYLDEDAYAISHWGAERAALSGSVVRKFRHFDPEALFAKIAGQGTARNRPVVIVDGFCPACGKPAPIRDYLDVVRHFGGLLVIDDTQSLGILGKRQEMERPYGSGGGGILPWHNVSGPDILVGASLAKGFGVPVAVLAGGESILRRFANLSDTRVHCSPPSVAVIHAAEHALAINQECGGLLRQRLAQRIRQFRQGLALIGLSATGGWFPVQSLRGLTGSVANRLHHGLANQGIHAVLSRPRHDTEVRLSFLITARHSPQAIERCIALLATLTAGINLPLAIK